MFRSVFVCRTPYFSTVVVRKSRLQIRNPRFLFSSLSASRWWEGLSPHDIEKELFRIKRQMGALYSKGDFGGALMKSIELEDSVVNVFGNKGAVYASCLNNVALMNKLVGNLDISMDKYTSALHAYEDAVGKKHPSYASTLANLGILYKTLAEKSTGMEKLNLLERAEESLQDALAIRSEMLGHNHKETISSSNHLALVWLLRGRHIEAEAQLKSSLNSIRSLFGNKDSLTATTLNNLGILLKSQLRHAEAKACYLEAIEIRSDSLGEQHPDTIVAMHNLAELLMAEGNTVEATELQEKILAITERAFGSAGQVEGEAAEASLQSNKPAAPLTPHSLDSVGATSSFSRHPADAAISEFGKASNTTGDEKAVAGAKSGTQSEPPKLFTVRPTKPANRKKPRS